MTMSSDATTEVNCTTAESKNKAKNDAKRAAKLEKFQAKQAKGEIFKTNSTAKPKTLEVSKATNGPIDDTPLGEKKDMSKPMASSYDPMAVEAAWYAWWEKMGLFKPECFGDVERREKFTIVMPPPNVTGSLHLGHATMLSIEDAIVRWYGNYIFSINAVPF